MIRMGAMSVVFAALAGLAALAACGISVDTGYAASSATPADGDAGGTEVPGTGPATTTDASTDADGGTGTAQIDLSSLFTVDVIISHANGSYDTSQVPVDASGYVLLTQSAEDTLFDAGHTGLPDNGFFPANADHPDVLLGYRNTDFGNNARRLAPPSDAVTIPLPQRRFNRLQIIGISTEGTTTHTATIRYLDGTESAETITYDDWYTTTLGPRSYRLIDGLDRASIGDARAYPYPDLFNRNFAVSGVDLTPNTARAVRDVTITCTSTSSTSTRFHLLGVVGD